jgi:hypothetical protein
MKNRKKIVRLIWLILKINWYRMIFLIITYHYLHQLYSEDLNWTDVLQFVRKQNSNSLWSVIFFILSVKYKKY